MTIKRLISGAKKSTPAKGLLMCGGWLLFIAAITVFERLDQEVDGVVVERYTSIGIFSRDSISYRVRATGGNLHELSVGGSDASLPSNIPVGVLLNKHRWQLGFTLNQKPELGFPISTYGR